MNEEPYYNLIIRYLCGEATAEEQKLLEKWRNASGENQKIFSDVQQLWQQAPPDLPERMPDLDHEWQETAAKLGLRATKGSARILQMKPRPASRTPFSGVRRTLAVAAVFTLIVLGVLFFNTQLDQQQRLATENAQQLQVNLPDGSLVHLNSGSEIRFPKDFTDSVRRVQLHGEAFFEVARDGRPFVVVTENAEVRVLGTAFNVWARLRQTKVTVKEGRVALRGTDSAQKSEVVLSANQLSFVKDNLDPTPPRTVDAEQLIGWLNGKLVFDKMSLAEIVAELEHVYDIEIALADASLRDTTLTGIFNKKPVTSILSSICLALNLRFDLEDGTYIISPK